MSIMATYLFYYIYFLHFKVLFLIKFMLSILAEVTDHYLTIRNGY